MLYGIKAGDKHSLTDWSMYLMRGWGISPASENRYQVKVPGADGYKDLTKALTGRVTYSKRTGTFPFKCSAEREAREAIYHEVMQSWHGKTLDIVTDAEPGYYYTGFMTVGAMTHLDHGFKCTVKADMEPFKWEVEKEHLKCDISAQSYFEIVPVTGGENVSKQSWNTDLRFGTEAIPMHDFSLYSSVKIAVKHTSQWASPVLQFEDGNGKAYNATNPITGGGITQWNVGISDLENAGLDPKTIWRVLASRGNIISFTGMAAGVTLEATGGIRNRELVITAPVEGVSVFFSGKEYPLELGENLVTGFELLEGENVLRFKSENVPTATSEVIVEYRRGWL